MLAAEGMHLKKNTFVPDLQDEQTMYLYNITSTKI
jgi:hypothetical protein